MSLVTRDLPDEKLSLLISGGALNSPSLLFQLRLRVEAGFPDDEHHEKEAGPQSARRG